MSERSHVEASLQRIEELIGALDQLQDPRARTMARDLAEAVLDVHGLALARIAARVSASPGGPALLDDMAQDEQIRAILLLHGLHPDDPETRIREAVADLKPRMAKQGAHIALIDVSDGVARLSLHVAGAGSAQTDMLRREIIQVVTDAAPDVEEILIAGEANASVALAS